MTSQIVMGSLLQLNKLLSTL